MAQTSPIASAAALALDAFARDVAGDSAIDSVVYDLTAYEASIPAASRYVGISRDGIHGFYADPEAANLVLLNRRALAPTPRCPRTDSHTIGECSDYSVVR